MKAIRQIFKNFIRHDCFYLSTHISFCAILSLIPLMLVAVSVVGHILGSSQEAYTQLITAISDVLPKGRDFWISNLKPIMGQSHSFGLIGIGILLCIATLLFSAIERGLDIIFEAERSRNFFHSRLLAIVLIGIVSLFSFLPTLADLIARGLTRFGFHFPLGEFLRGPQFYFLFSLFAFVLLVKVIPHHRVRSIYALFGGFFFAIAVIIAKHLFRWYTLKSFDQYHLIYGSLSAFFTLLLWIFYVSNILLFSAEIVAYLQFKKKT